MLSPDKSEVENVYEVRFKNTRKAFYRNVNGLRLYIGDPVVVESDRGYDVGVLSLGGVLAELQMKRKRHKIAAKDLPRLYRKANEKDIDLLDIVREREQPTLVRSREIIEELNLDMKLSDVEFQGDNAKAIFYYIADHRVDFRELIKVLAREFRIRVEMKQIGLRHEAGLVGGIGSCGRELCCSTWLTDFKTVSTSAARYQNLSLNPMKISGLCGRLKCCLNFELDAYLDALQDFPEITTLETRKGTAILQKTDIFKGMMWFSYPRETSWHPISIQEVKRIMAMNEKGERPEALATVAFTATAEAEIDFVDVVGTELPEIERRRRGRGGKKRRGKGGGGKNKGGGNAQNRNRNRNRNQRGPKGESKDKTQQPSNKGKSSGSGGEGGSQGGGSASNRRRGSGKGRGPRNQQSRNRSNKRGQGNQSSGNRNRNKKGGGNKPSNQEPKNEG